MDRRDKPLVYVCAYCKDRHHLYMIFIQITILSTWCEQCIFGSILQRSAVKASKECCYCLRSEVRISCSIRPFSRNGWEWWGLDCSHSKIHHLNGGSHSIDINKTFGIANWMYGHSRYSYKKWFEVYIIVFVLNLWSSLELHIHTPKT